MDILFKVVDKGIEKVDLIEWSFGELLSFYVKK